MNNAGVMRPGAAWEHSDDDVRLTCDVNLLGVIWGSLAAVDAMRAGPGQNRHIINLASLSSFGPVPGLALYAATKHAVLGFTGSLRATCWTPASRSRCTRSAPTPPTRQLLREHDHEPAAAINWSGPRLLTPDEVAEHAVALLDSKRLVRTIPPWRGWGARALAMAGRSGLRAAPLLRKQGAAHRIAFTAATNGGAT